MYSLIQFFSPCVLFRMVQHISTHKSMGPPTRISVWQIERKKYELRQCAIECWTNKSCNLSERYLKTWLDFCNLIWIFGCWLRSKQTMELQHFLPLFITIQSRPWIARIFCSFRFHFGNTQNKWSDSKHDAWYFSVRGDSYIALANSSNNTNHKLSLFRHDFI